MSATRGMMHPVESSALPPMTPPVSSQPVGATSPASPEPLLERPVGGLSPAARGVVVYLVAALALGMLAGVIWNWVVDLPGYRMGDNGSATMTERELTQFFTTDYWFSVVAVVGGLVLGAWGWWWFGRRGPVVVLLVVLAACGASAAAWWVGSMMGPHDFDSRLSQAQPGEVVSIDFELTALTALAMWPLAAILPVMLAAAFQPEPGSRAFRRPGRRRFAPMSAPASTEPTHQAEQRRSHDQGRHHVADADLDGAEQTHRQPEQDHPTGH